MKAVGHAALALVVMDLLARTLPVQGDGDGDGDGDPTTASLGAAEGWYVACQRVVNVKLFGGDSKMGCSRSN